MPGEVRPTGEVIPPSRWEIIDYDNASDFILDHFDEAESDPSVMEQIKRVALYGEMFGLDGIGVRKRIPENKDMYATEFVIVWKKGGNQEIDMLFSGPSELADLDIV